MNSPPTPPNPNDLLEQAHLAMLRGHTPQALTLLDTVIAVEPGNEEAQKMRDTLLARQVSEAQAMPPDTWDFVTPPPLSSPRQPTRRVPWFLLLPACLVAGLFITYTRGRHHYYSDPITWHEHLIFGAIIGVCLFFISRNKTY